MKKKYSSVIIISSVLVVIFFVALLAQFVINNKKVELPRLEIVLNEHRIDDVVRYSKDAKYYGDLTITTSDGSRDLSSDIQLKGRGNTTWGWQKSSFRIKFNQKTELFGMGESKKWILLANYFDKSNLRNALAFYLDGLLGNKYAIKGKFVKLYDHEEYLGIYYLTEKIEIGKDRINLRDPYGVVVELDNYYAMSDECYRSNNNDCLVLKDSTVSENESVAMDKFTTAFKQLEKAAKEGDYQRAEELGDVESFAIYYLLSEFTISPDAFCSSYYFYKDGDEDLIHVGPGWDYDLSMGSRFWGFGYNEEFYIPEESDALEMLYFEKQMYDGDTGEFIESIASDLIYNLLQIPEFREKVNEIYSERMMNKKEEVLKFIADQASYNEEAAIEDRLKWREYEEDIIQAVGPSGNLEGIKAYLHSDLPADEAYWADIDYLQNWVNRRFEYMDRTFGKKD